MAKVDLGGPGLLGRQLAVEGGDVLAALGIKGLGSDGVAARFRGPPAPVEGARHGDRRGPDLLDVGEVLVGEGRVVQLLQRQPAGEELRLGVVDARAHAIACRRLVGGLVVAGLKGRVDQALAHDPQRLGRVVAGR